MDGMMTKKFANHCLDRMTFGARPAEIASFNALGADDDSRLQAYLDQQLDWSSVDDSAFTARIAPLGYTTLDKTLQELWYDHHANSSVVGFDGNKPIEEMERFTLARALHGKRQLLEVMTDFWHNHFNIFGRDYYAQSVFVSWDRDVIRPPVAGHPRGSGFEQGHLFGNFRQMLELSSRHIAMQYYLDNYINQVAGPNENYAREVMELHTLGAENYLALATPESISRTDIPLPWGDAGADVMVSISDQYVDDDVYAAMRMLTGWKIKDRADRDYSDNEDSGEFFFYEPWHDKFEKTILGNHWGNNELAPGDIREFFDVLAYHPGTARHIAGKLCRRFISQDPDQSVIDAVADTFYQNRYAENQLELTYRTLFQSAEFNNPNNFGVIFKRPMEAMVSALRVCESEYTPAMVDDSNYWAFIYYYMQRAGQRPFYWPAPNGYPDDMEHWLGANGLLYVTRYMDWVCDRDYNSEKRLVPILDTTLAASIEALPLHSPNALATFWLTRILGYSPDGGWYGTDLHSHLSNFLTQNPNDAGLWPADGAFFDIGSTSGPYYFYERLRALVKLILSSSEFLHR
jgi:uncharacterized protein (DUF1800 family)